MLLTNPANIRRDEDVLKTSSSFVFIFRRRLQDVLIKTNIFALVIRPQKTSSRLHQDVLIKTNIFILVIRLQDAFKTFSRRLHHKYIRPSSTSSKDVFKTFLKRLQDVLQKLLQDIFKTSSRHP